MNRILLLLLLFCTQIVYSQSDCPTAIPVCGNSNISYNPTDHGDIEENLNGCLASDERFSVWYSFTIETSGTLTFTITPDVFNTDYDFAVYGPNAVCAINMATPIRCNYDGSYGPTGLSPTIPPANYPSGNDDVWSPMMNVQAGETYIMVIDNWLTGSSDGFSLTWNGTATLASPFTDPAITPNQFQTPGEPSSVAGEPNEIILCSLTSLFDFSSLTDNILNGNTNFNVSYHDTSNDALTGTNPITTPITINSTTTYYYSITYNDPNNPNNPLNKCREIGEFKFKQGNIVTTSDILYGCNNNNSGTATFNLTIANIYGGTGNNTFQYYPSLADMDAGTNEITNNLSTYVSGEKIIYVKVTTQDGCVNDDATITLKFNPTVELNDATIQSCFLEDSPNEASFDLTSAVVSTQSGLTYKYYQTLADALAGSNDIGIPDDFESTDGVVYVRATNSSLCYSIAKINLIVIKPKYSTILKDKYICIEDRTSLDAGPGFASYLWSTGATTQSISGLTIGEYWVLLQSGTCYTRQRVSIKAAPLPIITSVDINNNTVTVNAGGGIPPYKYSIDGTNWQDSNIFTGLPRGENTFYVKDSQDCNPFILDVTVPNLVNAITPNGDNINDYVDYQELAYKENLNFQIFDRYGNKIFTGEKFNNYRWDGKHYDKKIVTGTYWYTVTWNEKNKEKTPIKYNGWILVKNRE